MDSESDISNESLYGSNNSTLLQVRRPALDLNNMRLMYGYQEQEEQGLRQRLTSYVKRQTTCSSARVKDYVTRRLPILGWLPKYEVKKDLLGDVIAGITVAILHIPQGMGFALLANIPAICGIYMAFFPVIAYALLATSRHNSMGAFAIITMMTGNVVNKYATFPSTNSTTTATTFDTTLIPSTTMLPTTAELFSTTTELPIAPDTYTPIQVATIVCFMAGVWSVILGFFNVGSVTTFFNDMMVSAFSFGSAIHVLTSQIPDLLGISIGSYSGPFKLIYSYIDIFSSLAEVNVAAIVISTVSITMLVVNNELIKPRLAKITRIPVPIELIVVIIGTTASYLGNFPENFGIKIVGNIPTGLPAPQMPPMSLASTVAIDSLVIAIVAFAGSYSLAKIFADKHDYSVEPNQELYAMGYGNIFSSFFSCGPMASAIARVLIQESVGGVTQLACLITSFVILWVLLFLGPLFEYLPKACLASIIVVALKNMFLLILTMFSMWRVSRVDAMIWVVTAAAVVVIEVSYGLMAGVLVAVAVLIYRGQRPAIKTLGNIPNTDLYVEQSLYPQAVQHENITIVRVEGALHFANRENFKEKLLKVVAPALHGSISSEDDSKQVLRQTKYLLLDCESVSYIDALSAKYFTKLKTILECRGVILCLASLSDDSINTLKVMDSLKAVGQTRIFQSVPDAIVLLSRGGNLSYTNNDTLV